MTYTAAHLAACISPTLEDFVPFWNDSARTDDERRTLLLMATLNGPVMAARGYFGAMLDWNALSMKAEAAYEAGTQLEPLEAPKSE